MIQPLEKVRFLPPSPFIFFWQKHPALLLGLMLLIGTAFSLYTNLIDLFPLCLLLLPYVRDRQQWKRFALLLSIFAVGWALASYRCAPISLPHDKIEGEAQFTITSVKHYQSPFSRSLVYKGKLLNFCANSGETYPSIPCQIYLPPSKHPKANCDYTLTGTLEQKGPRQFVFKPQKNKEWRPIPSTYSLAELRYKAKNGVHSYFKKQIADRQTSTFLNALATGDIDERTLSLEFGRLGIQHILAISGFHFALIALFLGTLLQLFLSPKKAAWALLLLLSSYYLFLGDSPSIQRAWIAASAFLVGRIFNLRITALNALGVGLCVEILIDPSVISHLGFILSFLCTLAILLLFPLFLKLSNLLLPTRSFKTVKSMPQLDQLGYIMNFPLRHLLAVNLAVHIACLPVLLYLFHRFPLLSLVYNLFFPFWVSISLLLLCIACLFSCLLPPLGHLLHSLNEHWTSFALTIIQHPPAPLDFVIRMKSVPYPVLVLFLTALFIMAIFFTEADCGINPLPRWIYILKRVWKGRKAALRS